MTQNRPGTQIGTADVNGTRLYYEVRGAGRALLFLHGFTLDRRMWRHQVDELAKRYTVVTYDARGFGRSILPGPTPYRHCDDAAALCEHLGLTRVVAIGHSIGAHQMLEFALLRPDRVAGYVAMGMAGLGGIPFTDDITKMFSVVRQTAREAGIDAAKKIWGRNGWFAPARESSEIAVSLNEMLRDYSGWHWTHDNPAQNLDPPAAA